MQLVINLVSNNRVNVESFESVSSASMNGKTHITAENIGTFKPSGNETYYFKGSRSAIVRGKDIEYIEII